MKHYTSFLNIYCLGMLCNYHVHCSLHKAVGQGNTQKVAALIRSGADVNQKGTFKPGMGYLCKSPLTIAAERGDLQMVRLLVEHDACIDGYKTSGNPLSEAARKGHVEVMQWLLRAGAKVDGFINDAEWHKPLRVAAAKEQLLAMRLLLDAGAVTTGALTTAAACGKLRAVQLLIDADVHPNGTPEHRPLHAAARNGHCAAIELLIRAGADVNSHCRNCVKDTSLQKPNFVSPPFDECKGTVALQQAIRFDQRKAIDLLLCNGADSDLGCCETPLITAIKHQRLAIVRKLLQAGIYTDACDSKGRNALEWTKTINKHRFRVACTKLLLNHGAWWCQELFLFSTKDREFCQYVYIVTQWAKTVEESLQNRSENLPEDIVQLIRTFTTNAPLRMMPGFEPPKRTTDLPHRLLRRFKK